MTDNRPMKDVTDGSFEREVLQSNIPVLVDFWAAWSSPCKILEPTLEVLAQEYGGRVLVARVNVDENPEMAGRYGVKGIPTLILFKSGERKESHVGVRPKDQISRMIEPYID